VQLVRAATINPGDLLIIEGSLSWRAGRTKEAGRLQIVCFDVEQLTTSPSDETSPVDAAGGISTGEIVAPDGAGEVAPTKKGKARYPRWTGAKTAMREP
jgi:hypothetical protein